MIGGLSYTLRNEILYLKCAINVKTVIHRANLECHEDPGISQATVTQLSDNSFTECIALRIRHELSPSLKL